MKRIISILAAFCLAALFAASASAKDVPLYGKDAKMHRIVSADPGAVQVPSQYDKAIKIKKLGKDDVAYWNPDGGKYITAGDYAFVWAKVINTKSSSSKYFWIAINEEALDQAMDLMHRFQSGVAFYKITMEGKNVVMVAYPYSTLRSISEGTPTVNVAE